MGGWVRTIWKKNRNFKTSIILKARVPWRGDRFSWPVSKKKTRKKTPCPLMTKTIFYVRQSAVSPETAVRQTFMLCGAGAIRLYVLTYTSCVTRLCITGYRTGVRQSSSEDRRRRSEAGMDTDTTSKINIIYQLYFYDRIHKRMYVSLHHRRKERSPRKADL